MRPALTALISGLLFAAGLAISGMTRPEKVVGFLDFAGDWDPSLALVMASSIGVTATAWRIRRRRAAPLLAPADSQPSLTKIDGRLLAGSAIFGVGWGMTGMCPGPMIGAAGTGMHVALVALPSMLAGMALFRLWEWATANAGMKRSTEESSES